MLPLIFHTGWFVISLFSQKQFPNSRSLTFPYFRYVRDRWVSNQRALQQYYDFNEPAVRSNHILVVLLNSLLTPTSTSPARYVELANMAAYSVGRGLGMASAIYGGRLQANSWFYGPNIKEYLFLTGDNDINFDIPWKEQISIKVVAHPRSDVSFRLQDGKYSSTESGYAVIEINAGLMAYQLLQWRKENQRPIGEQMGVRHFVMKVILPQLLKSHLDVAFLNRLWKYRLGERPSSDVRGAPLRLPDSTTYVDSLIQQISEGITNGNLRFDEILENIPLPFGTTALSFMRAPDIAETRYSDAFFAMRSLPILELLVGIDYEVGSNANSKYIFELARALRGMRVERWLDTVQGDLTQIKERYQTNVISLLDLPTT